MKRSEKKAQKHKQKQALAATVQTVGKNPRTAAGAPPPSKEPKSLGIDAEDFLQRRPVWRFGDLDMEAPPSVGEISVADFIELHEKLGQYESQTCSEIWFQQPNGCKKYDVEGAHENITSRLVELERDDETAVHTLRVNGKYRIYGVLRENVFYVLWLDREHEMWPSQLKNT